MSTLDEARWLADEEVKAAMGKPTPFKDLLSPAGASGYLFERHGIKRAVPTLAKLRSRSYGTGPKFRKIGGSIRYDPIDLDAWVAGMTTYDHGGPRPTGTAD